MALERIGKQARIVSFTQVRDSIDLSGVRVPAELKLIPAFASLDGKGLHTLDDAAQIGALLMLGQTPAFNADLAISDPQLLKAINESLDALQAQVQRLEAKVQAPLGRSGDVRAGLAADGPQVRHVAGTVAHHGFDLSVAADEGEREGRGRIHLGLKLDHGQHQMHRRSRDGDAVVEGRCGFSREGGGRENGCGEDGSRQGGRLVGHELSLQVSSPRTAARSRER